MSESLPDQSEPRASVWIWPCDHGNVVVEAYGLKGHRCATCGATATKYVRADLVHDAINDAVVTNA